MPKPKPTDDSFVAAKFVSYAPFMDISVLMTCLLSETGKAASIFASSERNWPLLKPFKRS